MSDQQKPTTKLPRRHFYDHHREALAQIQESVKWLDGPRLSEAHKYFDGCLRRFGGYLAAMLSEKRSDPHRSIPGIDDVFHGREIENNGKVIQLHRGEVGNVR